MTGSGCHEEIGPELGPSGHVTTLSVQVSCTHSFLQVCVCLFICLWDEKERKRRNIRHPRKPQHQYTPVIPTCTICITHALWLVLTCTHSLRSHCSMRRWQYWKAFSLNRSFGGSRRLEEEVAETIETIDPSTSERSSAAREWVSELEKWVMSWKCWVSFTWVPVKQAGSRWTDENS